MKYIPSISLLQQFKIQHNRYDMYVMTKVNDAFIVGELVSMYVPIGKKIILTKFEVTKVYPLQKTDNISQNRQRIIIKKND